MQWNYLSLWRKEKHIFAMKYLGQHNLPFSTQSLKLCCTNQLQFLALKLCSWQPALYGPNVVSFEKEEIFFVMCVLGCSDLSVVWRLGNSRSSAVSSFLQHSPHCPHWWHMLLNLSADKPEMLKETFWWGNGSIASRREWMELLAAPLVFISSDRKQVFFI